MSQNDQLVLIAGESASGKSASLQNLKGEERVLYLNCESGKRLPFRNKFTTKVITDPMQIIEAFDHLQNGGANKFDTVVIDTLTFLMDMYESQYVVGAANGMQAWMEYGQFFKRIMQSLVPSVTQSVIILAHTRADLDEKAMEMRTSVPIKGALKNNGVESYFSTVVATKKIALTTLEDYNNDLLEITEQDELLGYKHVFQTQLTKQTIGERIRSPMGMFTRSETFIDNDAQGLIDHLHSYYS